ncbi:hypothetical protein B0J14DRAFT_618070 [Halenospora varia]|nr:hypothetical protein B0J14DRAFT_618070 [Halenospora varia]
MAEVAVQRLPYNLKTIANAKQFFSLPLEEKMKIHMTQSKTNRGYEILGAQMLEPGTEPDTKEGVYFGEELPAEHPRALAGDLGDDFNKLCMEYFYAARNLSNEILRALAIGLSVNEGYFDEFNAKPAGTLKLLHYPPTPTSNTKARDEVGGLQVLDEPSGEWTNHRYTSNIHRVMNFSGKERYSIPFFHSADQNYVFGCIPGCEDKDGSKFEKMKVGDFFKSQFDSTFERVKEQKENSTIAVETSITVTSG